MVALAVGTALALAGTADLFWSTPTLEVRAESAPVASPLPRVAPALPERLRDTGLYAGATEDVDPRALPFSPQYPLWTDGATKRRWLLLPEGSAIDARDPDDWQFPIGTRVWKEFSFGGRRVETRFMERLPDGSWRYATYLWSAKGDDARLLPPTANAMVPIGDRALHEVPREDDCRACHESRSARVLGFGALQLSPDRDPRAPHAEPVPEQGATLSGLVQSGQLENLPKELLTSPPRVRGRTPRERAALGYLFGNCSGCHNAQGPLASLGLDFDQRVAGVERPRAFESAIGVPSRFQIPGLSATKRIEPGRPEASAVLFRMSSRFPATQMPPLGTRQVDREALALLRVWISSDLEKVGNATGEER